MTREIKITKDERDMLVAGLEASIDRYFRDIKAYKTNYSDGAPECVSACWAEIHKRTKLATFLRGLGF